MAKKTCIGRAGGRRVRRLPWQAVSSSAPAWNRRNGLQHTGLGKYGSGASEYAFRDIAGTISNIRKEVGMRLEGHLDQAVEGLIGAIKESDAYRKYLSALTTVKQQPGLKQQIDEFRRENYVMQNTGDMAFERIEQFELAYSDFRENPLVADFLAAELDLCRQIQQINFNITEALNFE